ncbi:AmmeMemoRadiSam system protein A [Methanosphaera sp.]
MERIVFSEKEGQLLIEQAKLAILSYLNDEEYPELEDIPEILNKKLGVFVTLNKKGSLRGCIGTFEAEEPLYKEVQEMAIYSAFYDNRFNMLQLEEIDDIKIEISILTEPELVEVDTFEEYFSKIELGVDGLRIEKNNNVGVFLPQVPLEQGWGMNNYLENLCYKAGLPNYAWKDKNTKIYKFQAQIFEEKN